MFFTITPLHLLFLLSYSPDWYLLTLVAAAAALGGYSEESPEVCHSPSPLHIDSLKIKPLHDVSHRRAGAADLLSLSDLTSLAGSFSQNSLTLRNTVKVVAPSASARTRPPKWMTRRHLSQVWTFLQIMLWRCFISLQERDMLANTLPQSLSTVICNPSPQTIPSLDLCSLNANVSWILLAFISFSCQKKMTSGRCYGFLRSTAFTVKHIIGGNYSHSKGKW